MDSKTKTAKQSGDINNDNELLKMAESPTEGPKYSSGSSVYASQSIANPATDEMTYCIASIIQSEIFDHLQFAATRERRYPDLNILTTLPSHLGGPVPELDPELVRRETVGDPELREKLLEGTVPTVDTILRFICWINQSAKYSAQCNIIAFIYVKRMLNSHRILHMNNWRGVWLGAIIIAQKFADDKCLRTSSFASILPGVSKEQLKAAEMQVFEMLDYTGQVKPSTFAKFYFELRSIFQAITGYRVGWSKGKDGKLLPPLRQTEGLKLYNAPEERYSPRPESSPRKTDATAKGPLAPLPPLPPLAPSKSQDLRGGSLSTTAGIASSRPAGEESATATTKLPPLRLQPSGGKKAPGGSKTSLKYASRHPRAITVEDQQQLPSKAIFVLN